MFCWRRVMRNFLRASPAVPTRHTLWHIVDTYLTCTVLFDTTYFLLHNSFVNTLQYLYRSVHGYETHVGSKNTKVDMFRRLNRHKVSLYIVARLGQNGNQWRRFNPSDFYCFGLPEKLPCLLHAPTLPGCPKAYPNFLSIELLH